MVFDFCMFFLQIHPYSVDSNIIDKPIELIASSYVPFSKSLSLYLKMKFILFQRISLLRLLYLVKISC